MATELVFAAAVVIAAVIGLNVPLGPDDKD
jgi:hypothetical protein